MTDLALGSGVIAVVRLPEVADLRAVRAALAAGGVGAVEITLTTPGAVDGIAALARDADPAGPIVGAGTVLDERAARAVIAAGAKFVVSPTFDPAVTRSCREHDIPCVPGAFTPTELLTAWQAGATLLKLFPATTAGPSYLREVLAPLPSLRIVPSGGVSVETAGDWIRAGAAAVSVGGALVSPALVRNRAWEELSARARALVECVAQARRQVAQARV